MRFLRRLLIVLVLLTAALFAAVAVDQQPVSLSFLVWQTPAISVFWWLLAAFLLGGACVGALTFVGSTQNRLQTRKLQKTLDATEAEVTRLKSTA